MNVIDLLKNIFNNKSEKNALVFNEIEISYKNLSTLVHDTLDKLNTLKPYHILALDVPKTNTSIILLLALLKKEAVYVPINQLYPQKIKENIYGQLNVDFVYTFEKKLVANFAKNDRNLNLEKDIIYILTTSGSTGEPKFIPINKTAFFTFIKWAADTFIEEDDVVYSISPLNFDLSVFDIFSTLYKGATLVIANDNIIDPLEHLSSIIRTKATLMYATPSFIRQLFLRAKSTLPYFELKKLLLAGETLNSSDIAKAKHLFPYAKIYNLYGPTESNVVTFDCVNETDNPISIGKACPYADIIFIDDKNEVSDIGEICIAGDSLFKGYLFNYKTPTIVKNKKIYFKTGDIGYRKDEKIYFLHRNDRMIKHNGFRVDLNEIECFILNNKNVSEVAVIQTSKNEYSIIKAFIICDACEPQDIRLFLKNYLPPYAIPKEIKIVDYLPKLSSGKLDYQKLT